MKKEIKIKSPFKDLGLLIKQTASFLKSNNAVFKQQSKRLSDFFEMSIINSIVQYYHQNGYIVTAKNLKNNVFIYKIQPNGYPENFSYFYVNKIYKNRTYEFEIHHNLAIQSAHEQGIYTTPDISVIKRGTTTSNNEHYLSKKKILLCKK